MILDFVDEIRVCRNCDFVAVMGSGRDVTGFHLNSSRAGVDRSWYEADRFLTGSGIDHGQTDLVYSRSLDGPSRRPTVLKILWTSPTLDRTGTELKNRLNVTGCNVNSSV